MSKINESLTNLGQKMALVAGFIVLIISLLSSFEVVMRYFLNVPTGWTFEVSRYLLTVLIWLGAMGTLQNDSHISVEFVVERLPQKIGRVIMNVAYIIALLYSFLVMWQTWLFYVKATANDWKTIGNVPIPASWLYLTILLGNFFLCIALLQKIYEVLTRKAIERIKIEI